MSFWRVSVLTAVVGLQEEEIDLEAELGVELGTGDDGDHEGT
jgi:hypothetical protein